MPRTKLGFCTLHRIAYNRQFDATCPQCLIAGVIADQLDYDPDAVQTQVVTQGGPVDASGKLVNLDGP